MQVCKALSDPTRRGILELLLEEGELCVCELNPEFDRDGSVIYRHVMKLEDANLVETEKDGRRLHCSVPRGKEVERLLDSLEVLESEATDTR